MRELRNTAGPIPAYTYRFTVSWSRQLHPWLIETLMTHLPEWDMLHGLVDISGISYKLRRQNELLSYIARDHAQTFDFRDRCHPSGPDHVPTQAALQVRDAL
jgi:hypothetical protein